MQRSQCCCPSLRTEWIEGLLPTFDVDGMLWESRSGESAWIWMQTARLSSESQSPKGPCAGIVYALAPKYLHKDYRRSMHYLDTWTHREPCKARKSDVVLSPGIGLRVNGCWVHGPWSSVLRSNHDNTENNSNTIMTMIRFRI